MPVTSEKIENLLLTQGQSWNKLSISASPTVLYCKNTATSSSYSRNTLRRVGGKSEAEEGNGVERRKRWGKRMSTSSPIRTGRDTAALILAENQCKMRSLLQTSTPTFTSFDQAKSERARRLGPRSKSTFTRCDSSKAEQWETVRRKMTSICRASEVCFKIGDF